MVNWELFSPRNFFIVAVMSVVAYAIYTHFAGSATTVMEA